jgi:hypothetical protein
VAQKERAAEGEGEGRGMEKEARTVRARSCIVTRTGSGPSKVNGRSEPGEKRKQISRGNGIMCQMHRVQHIGCVSESWGRGGEQRGGKKGFVCANGVDIRYPWGLIPN